ncbi:response regulator transcription factor [Bacillus sp. 31A1R]|uniref:Response regulator transcription factor n=1 Tax=Robertmurraya mangrovi TaxID=3098077 RepID=A0ABU5IY16_9BACI|nr:response regulator transcription factor [Bacillus sp. 31A1R]MDZ5472044.1 response regulator transcription factor [Bacillus sp. 31A1R]
MKKVMIIEDDPKIRTLVNDYLKKWGFQTVMVEHFESIDDQFTNEKPDLVLLDINLPSFDGYYWCNKIRQKADTPIIFISSRTETMDIIMAMNLGGDDFIQKPFALEVLVAKIQAVLRRSNRQIEEIETLRAGELVLHVGRATITYKTHELTLTKNEYQIMYLLIKNVGWIVSRDEIMRALWEDEEFIDDNTLTVNVNRLRKKLESIGLQETIVTKKRQGYILDEIY